MSDIYFSPATAQVEFHRIVYPRYKSSIISAKGWAGRVVLSGVVSSFRLLVKLASLEHTLILSVPISCGQPGPSKRSHYEWPITARLTPLHQSLQALAPAWTLEVGACNPVDLSPMPEVWPPGGLLYPTGWASPGRMGPFHGALSKSEQFPATRTKPRTTASCAMGSDQWGAFQASNLGAVAGFNTDRPTCMLMTSKLLL